MGLFSFVIPVMSLLCPVYGYYASMKSYTHVLPCQVEHHLNRHHIIQRLTIMKQNAIGW